MSKVLRRSKTKEKVSAQYGVADPDPADLDVRQTRNRQYPAAPPITGGTWRDRANIRERSESPIFISTTPDAMSTDEAIEISKKIDQEIAQEEADKGQTEEKAILGADDTLPTVEELQTPKSAEELYEEIKEELGPSGVVSFPKYEKELLGKAAKEKEKVDQGIRAPLITSVEGEKLFEIKQIPPLTYGDLPDFDKIIKEGDEFIEQTYSMMSDLEKGDTNSQSFVILHRGEKEVSYSIYENITQDLKVITAYIEGVYSKFGGSKKILSDNGSEFKNQLFEKVAKELGVEFKCYTAPYHPQSNGRIEGFHHFLKACMTKHISTTMEWDQVVHLATAAYNFFPNEHSRESPFYLMFGRDPRLPLNTLLKPKIRYLGDEENILSLEALQRIYLLVAENLRLARERMHKNQ